MGLKKDVKEATSGKGLLGIVVAVVVTIMLVIPAINWAWRKISGMVSKPSATTPTAAA